MSQTRNTLHISVPSLLNDFGKSGRWKVFYCQMVALDYQHVNLLSLLTDGWFCYGDIPSLLLMSQSHSLICYKHSYVF